MIIAKVSNPGQSKKNFQRKNTLQNDTKYGSSTFYYSNILPYYVFVYYRKIPIIKNTKDMHIEYISYIVAKLKVKYHRIYKIILMKILYKKEKNWKEKSGGKIFNQNMTGVISDSLLVLCN